MQSASRKTSGSPVATRGAPVPRHRGVAAAGAAPELEHARARRPRHRRPCRRSSRRRPARPRRPSPAGACCRMAAISRAIVRLFVASRDDDRDVRSAGPPPLSFGDAGMPRHLRIERLDRADEPAPAEVDLRIAARGLGRAAAARSGSAEHARGSPRRARRSAGAHQHGALLGEHRPMRRNVRGDDRPAGGEVVEHLERQVAAVGARGDEHIGHCEVGGHRLARLPLHDLAARPTSPARRRARARPGRSRDPRRPARRSRPGTRSRTAGMAAIRSGSPWYASNVPL